MVYLNSISFTERNDRLNQSVDFAIRDLLHQQSDPLSLAYYLYVFSKNNFSSINADRVADWGKAWIRKIFVDCEIGKRRDEEIASASLVILSLSDNVFFTLIQDEIITNFGEILSKEIKINKIPFRSLTYSSLLLLAASKLSINNPQLEEIAREVGKKIVDSISGGRNFGLIFGIQLLQNTQDFKTLNTIKTLVLDSLKKTNTSYEDQIYLLQALWSLNPEISSDSTIVDITENILKNSPAWQYLMNGLEDISPAGDGHSIIYLSHLFRATLKDTLTNYQLNKDAHDNAQLDARYAVRTGVSWSAFGFFVLIFLIAWSLVFYLTYTYGQNAISYWFLGDYQQVSKTQAIIFLIVFNLIIYLGILTFKMIPLLYNIFIRLQIGSDKRILEYLLPQLKAATILWVEILALEFLYGIFVELIIPSIQHTIGKPEN